MRHIPHLHLPPPWADGTLELGDSQRRHLQRVLRLGDGVEVSYTDGRGLIGSGRLSGAGVVRGEEASVGRPTELTVVVPPPSARDRLRFLVEKTAELGVARLLWVRTVHTEGRFPPADKAASWAMSALEQSRGGWLMEIGTTSLADLDPGDLVIADPGGTTVAPIGRRTLLVGPEGGLEADEIPSGASLLSLGPTVLRVETAAIAGIVSLISHRPPSAAH